MTEEEYFRKNYLDYCYGNILLSPYWDLFQDGVEFGERQSEKEIADLKETNAILSESSAINQKDIEYKVSVIKQRNKMIADLEKKVKEYEYLGIKELQSETERLAKGNNYLTDQLTKAKELLNEFMRISKASDEDFEHDYSELIGEAEQFLKEIEK